MIKMTTFGKRLKVLREKKELSQEVLGRKLHLSQSIIAHYEAGRKQPSQDILQRLADFFGVSIDYLLGRSLPANPTPAITPEDEKKLEEYEQQLDEVVSQIKEIFKKYTTKP